MTIGLGQILVIVLVIVLLFGNLPKIIKDVAISIKNAKQVIQEESEHTKIEGKENKKDNENTK